MMTMSVRPQSVPPLTEPQVDLVLANAGGKFMAVTLAARRARVLHDYLSGTLDASAAPPQVRASTTNPLSLALAEIAEAKILPVSIES